MTESRRLEHHGRRMTLSVRTSASPQQVHAARSREDRPLVRGPRARRGHARRDRALDLRGVRLRHPYEVKDAVPGERFALGGQLPGRPPFLLEVTIQKDGGETLVTLVNSGFLEKDGWDDEYEGIHSGWTMALALLKHYLENHDGLERWLAKKAAIGAVGEPVSLELQDGGTLRGRVLAISKWEVGLLWSETGGVLELKGFKGPGGQQVVSLRGTFWGKPALEVKALEARLQPALMRLAGLLAPAVAPAP